MENDFMMYTQRVMASVEHDWGSQEIGRVDAETHWIYRKNLWPMISINSKLLIHWGRVTHMRH